MVKQIPEVKEQVISPKLEENVTYLNNLLGIGTTWDVIAKPFKFGRLNMMSYVANGFFLTMNVVLILENLQASIEAFEKKHENEDYTLDQLVVYLNTNVSFVQVQVFDKMADAVRFILSGPLMTFIDGYDKALMIDTRIYPMRSITEPTMERVARGNHDGFTETMLMNTSLIRRRLRDPRLRVELMQIGNRGQNDVSFMYLKDVADEGLVKDIRGKLKSIDSGGLVLGEQQVMDYLGKLKWNPYPIARYTERPDVASTALLEGQVVIVVDNTPEVIVAPSTFWQHMQHPQEYHSYPMIGTYLRWLIAFAVYMSIFLPGVFLLVNAHPHWVPKWGAFFLSNRHDPLPLWAQLLVAEVSLDILRLAVINTPSVMASAVGIVAALLFGQFATTIQLLQPEVLVYMGFVMMAQYATSSYELGSANQMARFWIMGWTAIFGVIGFAISFVSWFILLATMKTFGKPYLWPLIPFKWKHGLTDTLIRQPSYKLGGVPEILRRRRGRA
ncbi:spore germination protein [Alicyclobacillus fastidiosus]|uniref:Spore germination protein n=1 Tax=Alicyclobacillus fastidiosus TaxID=392011 RepID=A0ABY6ZB97_9BACL|nr:spore germination protein [Alicyclobacillus fastidiosus]WAH40112.1 spore germination protein [Alicyclobacillus fastidiosus]